MVAVMAHVLVVAFQCNSCISPGLLHKSDGQKRECKDYENANPDALCLELSISVAMGEQVVDHVDVVLQVLSRLVDVYRTVVVVQKV